MSKGGFAALSPNQKAMNAEDCGLSGSLYLVSDFSFAQSSVLVTQSYWVPSSLVISQF